ncbi:hypothetical protein ccbrp13_27210 [Ktedonobacteria bacterium brp13]|nr:hypothetical protein ccbrp13_27210 [Ktedonobacteria bacterium brp13]
MRIDSLSYNNLQTQGTSRRAWLREHAPQHLQQCAVLTTGGLMQRSTGTSRSTLVLGAGACTEVPLTDLVRSSEEVVLADTDLAAMQRGRDELSAASMRNRVRFVQCDISGGVSSDLLRLARRQDWQQLARQGANVLFDAAADCLEQCKVPDPPNIYTLRDGDFGLVVSSVVLTQLFSYPLLDLMDRVKEIDENMLLEQERHRRYQDAAQNFRIRVIRAHLHFMRKLVDLGGRAVLLTDIRGFAQSARDPEGHHRRTIPLVPRIFPELIGETFTVVEEAQWEWMTDLPEEERFGRGYEVSGYILAAKN